MRVTKFTARKIGYEFYGEQFDIPVWGVFSLSFLVGIVGGIYGIGGGAIIAPFFVSILRLPVYTIAGATLMGTFVTSMAGVGFFQAIAPYYPSRSVAPDWTLGILFGLGGMAGMYLGARCQKYIPARVIKWMLVVSYPVHIDQVHHSSSWGASREMKSIHCRLFLAIGDCLLSPFAFRSPRNGISPPSRRS